MNKILEKARSFTTAHYAKEQGVYPYFRPISSEQDTEVIINGKKVLMFGSNSYLGLTNHPKLKEASKNAVDKYGSGCAGSRFLNGTLDIHIELEEKLAHFVGKEGALVFSTGYQVNLGTIPALLDSDDYAISDTLNHACIIDGTRLARSTSIKFKHNDMQDLDDKLSSISDSEGIKLILVDGVFSMEGDVAPLDKIVQIAKKHNANIMVDDAHGLGVLGDLGKGTANHFGMTDDVDLIMGTFSKSLASIGGFIAADKDTIHYLKHHARSLIFSASIAPANAASVIAALDIIQQEPERLQRLWDNTKYAKTLLDDAGFETGHSTTPIIPIYVRDMIKTFVFTQKCIENGIFINPVIPPAVPLEDSLVRFSLMATHTFAQIESGVNTMKEIAKELNILR